MHPNFNFHFSRIQFVSLLSFLGLLSFRHVRNNEKRNGFLDAASTNLWGFNLHGSNSIWCSSLVWAHARIREQLDIEWICRRRRHWNAVTCNRMLIAHTPSKATLKCEQFNFRHFRERVRHPSVRATHARICYPITYLPTKAHGRAYVMVSCSSLLHRPGL